MNSKLDRRRPIWQLEYVAKESFARPLLPSVELHGSGGGGKAAGGGGGESLFAKAAREQAAQQAHELRGGRGPAAVSDEQREADRWGKAREYYETALLLTAPPRRIDERVGKRVRGKLLKACKGTTPSILFKRWDLDGEGTLDDVELRRLIRLGLKIRPEVLPDADIQVLVDALDDDGSGAISIEELADFVENGDLAPSHAPSAGRGEAHDAAGGGGGGGGGAADAQMLATRRVQDERKRGVRARALMGLAVLMQDGRGGYAEMDRAVALVREAYEVNGSSVALLTYGLYHHMGRGMRQDLHAALSLYDEFLESGNRYRRWDACASEGERDA